MNIDYVIYYLLLFINFVYSKRLHKNILSFFIPITFKLKDVKYFNNLNNRIKCSRNIESSKISSFTPLKSANRYFYDSDDDVEDVDDDYTIGTYTKNRQLREAWLSRNNNQISNQYNLHSSWQGINEHNELKTEKSSFKDLTFNKSTGNKCDFSTISKEYLNREYERSWEFGAEVPKPKIEKLDRSKLNLTMWPKNTFLRIKLLCAYRKYINLAVHRIRDSIRDSKNLKFTRVITIPKKVKKFLLICSPTIDKRSKDHYKIEQHTRIIDIYPQDNIDTSKIKFNKLLLIPMPIEVKYESWFQEINGPKKSDVINRSFTKKWISKYYIYNRDREAKIDTINQILNPDNKSYIPLRWPNTFYDLYKIPLPQLQGMLKRINHRQDLDRQYEIFDIQRPTFKPLPQLQNLKLNVVSLDDLQDD